MDGLDAVKEWAEAARRSTFLKKNFNVNTSPPDMGSFHSRQLSPQNSKHPADRENRKPSKRQRIGITDLVGKLEKRNLARKEAVTSERSQQPHSLAITLKGILDKYGEEHESLIPRRLDGVPVKTRCSLQIYYPTTECRKGTLTDIHEELLRVSKEGSICTTWNPETGSPETEINLPCPFVIPIRELYVPKPPANLSKVSFEARSEISASEEDFDEPLNQGEYGLAEKYFCHVSFSTVREPPWPPLGLENEISRTSVIGTQLKHGLSDKRDLRLVSKMELSPVNSLPLKAPLQIKLGPDRQSTQYQLILETKWTIPAPKPSCIWRLESGNEAPLESKMDNCSCMFCLAKFDSIKPLQLHLHMEHSWFNIDIRPSARKKQCFIISASNKVPDMPGNTDGLLQKNKNTSLAQKVTSVNEADGPANKPPSADLEMEGSRSIFRSDDPPALPSCGIMQEPLPIMELARSQHSSLEPEKPLPQVSSASASAVESRSKKSSPNTTPDSASDSDGPLNPRKRMRTLHSRPSVVHDEDDSGEEDTSPQFVVPKTLKPLYDIVTKRLLKPGEPWPLPSVSHDWRIRKHVDVTNDYIDITSEEKDFINRWDVFILHQRSTSKIFMPLILKEFINTNRQWLDEENCRKKELLKHLISLTLSGRIEEKCFWECLEMFQSKAISARKASAIAAKHNRKSRSIQFEENTWLELWDAYVKGSRIGKWKFFAASKHLRTCQSMHASPGQPMLSPFLTYHSRTSTQDLLVKDNMFYNTNLPLPAKEAEREYVRYFDGFKENFKAKDESQLQLMFSFFTENTEWFNESIERIAWAKKHLQELHWGKQISLSAREKLLTYLETVENAYDTDGEEILDLSDANRSLAVSLEDPHNKVKGKEIATPAAFQPRPTENDIIQGPRPRNVRAWGECECGGHVLPGEAMMCASKGCIARVYHRSCVTDAPPRGTLWFCRGCSATEGETA